MKPTVISTFAGCGGSSLGYKIAGFKELLAVECDENAIQTFHLNFPDVKIFPDKIEKLTLQEIIKLTGIKVGELDIFDGSPPCQGFSTAGSRKFSDPRNSLFKEFARLLRGLQPKVFVMENVTGMVKGYMKQAYLKIVEELRDCGYNVRGQVLNAKYYNVPQSRERVIIIGVRKDLKIDPSHPKPQTKPLCLKDVLPSLAATRSQKINPWIPNSKPAATLLKSSDSYEGLPELNDKYGKLWPRIKPGGSAFDILGKGQNSCVKIDPDKPSPTLPKTQTGRGFATICHPYEPRALTINEAKIIGSFPEDFKFVGTYSEQWARIGNSVPPNLMLAIAKHIKDNILDKIHEASFKT